MAKAGAVMYEGVKDRPAPKRQRPPDPGKPREVVTKVGIVLPTGVDEPPR